MKLIPLELKALEDAGFTIDRTDRWLVLVLPDGLDGVLVDVADDAPVDTVGLRRLANDRRAAIAAITTLLSDAGWGMKSDCGGEMLLGCRSVSSSIHLGWPLSYWLRHESWTAAVRRFLRGFAGVPDDTAIERAAAIDSRARSEGLYRLHLEVCEEIDRNAVELDVDPTEQARMQEAIESYRRESEAAHADRIRSWIVSSEVSAQMDQEIDRARSDILVGGRGMWIGADPLWAAADDEWISVSEWVEFASAVPEEYWIGGGAAPVLMRFAPETYRGPVLDRLLLDSRSGALEHDDSDARLAAHFLEVAELADWVVGAQPCHFAAGPVAAVPEASMFGAYLRLRACLGECPTKSASQTLLDLSDLLGQPLFPFLTTAGTRETLKKIARLALEESSDRQRASVLVLSLSRLAWLIGDRELAERLLLHPVWRDALLYRLGSLGFLTLKESILALSLVCSGPACSYVIESAFVHLADAYEPHQIDTTALALAVAWRRCCKAAARTGE